MTSSDVRDRRSLIRAFISTHVGDVEFSDSVDIFEAGLVRSMFVMQLVLFVEQQFGIAIGGDDLSFDGFRSIDAIDQLVARKLN
jgi:acyl carrier protein